MKLKKGFITHIVGGKQVMVDVGKNGFKGIVQSNRTAAFIVDRLKQETTEEEILDCMQARFDAPREIMHRDLKKILEKLRSIGALEE